MLSLLHLDLLKEGKVLLAFSGGVDSTALFHLLRSHNIVFDIAHVNYHTRPSSDQEAQSAEELAIKHNLRCYTHSCHLVGKNFEHRAREERYTFLKYLVEKYNYTYVLTAHQLNDRLEWLMMQFCRGSGLPELLGIRSIDSRDGMTLIRPLLEHDRQSIEEYLAQNHLSHFIDESNNDERYTRNIFRRRFSTPLMQEYREAIKRSFRYLEEDNAALIKEVCIEHIGELYYFLNPKNSHSLIVAVDGILKSLGHVMSGHEKELLKQESSLIIGRTYCVSIEEKYTFIVPYITEEKMDKKFKEVCRNAKIEPKMRGYLATHPQALEVILRLKDDQAPLRFD
ncbi:MAG: tRNA lysidine(34) synthetase TilS [Sulfuricurvum sp.]|nr:tRNA lysidine(34) synthetase TilS [Sulfuricurvum sp.]